VYPVLYEASQKSRAGFPFKTPTQAFWDATVEERRALMEEGWSRGGFAFNQGTYRDFITDREANKIFYQFWADKVRQRVTDPEKAQVVAPLPQKAFFATKRPSLEQDYYEVINRPNVHVVDLQAAPVERFYDGGIATATRQHELDIIVLATGFDAVTGSLLNMGLEGRDGVALQEKWRDGVQTYLGLMVPDMPNMFMIYGPQAPTSFANGPPIIEIQVDLIAQTVERCRSENILSVEAETAAAGRWAEEVRKIGDNTLYPTADSWYMGANIPGKPRQLLLYLGGVDTYAQKCREVLRDWSGFTVTREHSRGQSRI